MYCIVIKVSDGSYHRQVVESLPTEKDLEYWEEQYSIFTDCFLDSVHADVINVFEIG